MKKKKIICHYVCWYVNISMLAYLILSVYYFNLWFSFAPICNFMLLISTWLQLFFFKLFGMTYLFICYYYFYFWFLVLVDHYKSCLHFFVFCFFLLFFKLLDCFYHRNYPLKFFKLHEKPKPIMARDNRNYVQF